MSTQAKFWPDQTGRLVYYDGVTFEEILDLAPIRFYDDFLGAGDVAIPVQGAPIAGMPWVKRLVGTAPSVAGVANASGGVIALTLTSTSEKQEATLYQNDQLGFNVTKTLVWEAVVNLGVLPTGNTQFVAGLSSAWIDGPNNASGYLEFGSTGNGVIDIRSQDGTTQNSIAAGFTATANQVLVLRIDATYLPQINFYINGNQVNANGAVTFVATGSSAILQPYFSVYKASGAGLGTLNVDACRVNQHR